MRTRIAYLIAISAVTGTWSSQAHTLVEPASFKLPFCKTGREQTRETATIITPKVGASGAVDVGGKVYLDSTIIVAQEGIRVDREVSWKGTYKGADYVVTVPPMALHQADVVERFYAFPPGSLKFTDPAVAAKAKVPKLGVIDDKDGTRFVAKVQFGSFVDGVDLPPDALTELRCIVPSRITSKEILYGGVVKGVLALQYRELVNGAVIPGSAQEGQFDLSAGSEIEFKGVHMKIVSATNTGIRYVVTDVQPL